MKTTKAILMVAAVVCLGGDGNDSLYPGPGSSILVGGSGVDTIAPLASSPTEIFAYSRIGDSLQVDVRGEVRSQPVIADYSGYFNDGKILVDADSSEDFIVDENMVV